MASDSTAPASSFHTIPLILGFSSSLRRDQGQEPQPQQPQPHARIILINLLTQRMVFIETNQSLENLFRNKEGLKPASRESIEAMPKVAVEDGEEECSICLDGWEVCDEAREMPCKHRYHSKCIEKWLRMNGSCPVCRYEMPLERDEDDDRGRPREGEEIWVRFGSLRGDSTGHQDQNPESQG